LEPLKVRMITVGDGDNWALKPLQRAMFNSLAQWKCFLPCFTPDYDDQVKEMASIPGYWLSGDYSSATDGLNSQIMSVCTEEIVNLLETQYPELIPYVLMESSPHIVQYPRWTGIEPIEQTNGQLMGSLLSFPILSIANAFTISKATGSSLNNLPALIHGDDVLARLTKDQFNRWKSLCPNLGLELSIGKNYWSNNWGSIDSQIFFEGQRITECGKWEGLGSNDPTTITTLLKRGFPEWLIVSRMKLVLQKTHKSLEVSTEFGGLNPNPGLKPQTATDHAQYLASLRRRCTVRPILNYRFASVPENWFEKLPFEPVILPFDLPHPDARGKFSDFREVVKLRNRGLSIPSGEFVSLESPVMYIELRDSQESFLKNYWKSLCPVLTREDTEYFTALKNCSNLVPL